MTSVRGAFLLGVLSLLFPLIMSNAAKATVSFKSPEIYPTGRTPMAVAVGDFNGDGKSDLAVANFGNPASGDDGSVSILLGKGDGTFLPASNAPTGNNPFMIATGDFNRDGNADLVLIDATGVGVLPGRGDGTFGPVTYLPTVSVPLSLAVADCNGDNTLDLVVAAQSSLSVLLGNGDGTFQAHVDYPAGGPYVAVADINGDGKMDLITERPQNGFGLTVLLGNGDGTFKGAIVTSVLALGSQQLALADLNLDGKPDVALGFVNPRGKGTLILGGNGDGTFEQSSATLPLFGSTSFADFNGDGKPDLAVIDIVSGGTVSLFLGNGDGTFQSPLSFAIGTGGATPTSSAPLWTIAVADLDQDNESDLVVTNSLDNSISVLLNNTGADFSIYGSAPTPGTISRGQSSTSTVTLAHLNSFDKPVALSCSVQPAQSATCALNPNSISFDVTGNATATLTINTGAATALLGQYHLRPGSRPPQFPWPVAGLALAGAGLGSRRSSRRKLMVCALGSVLFGGLIFQSACGGSEGPASTTYTITITGTSGSTQHSTTVPLIVN